MLFHLYRQRPWIWLIWSFVLGLSFVATGCGDKEPQQRSSFIIFLQTEIINKNRINPPLLTSVQQEQFGPYAQDYQILVTFNDDLKEILSSSLSGALQDMKSMRSVKELLANKTKISTALAAIGQTEQQLTILMTRAQQEREILVYPDDLKNSFDNAYAKVVIQQAEQVERALPEVARLFNHALELISFIESQNSQAVLLNNKVEFADQSAVERYNQLNSQLQKSAKEVQRLSIQNR